MALTKTKVSITQVTATGNSTDVDLSDSYRHSWLIKHVNGTGTITAGATIVVRAKKNGGGFRNVATFIADKVASSEQHFPCALEDDDYATDLDYTAPTGSTGHTLDGDVGKITAL